ncbi:MAG: hypothetical protein KJI71_01235 [Patescibacteria group bacterium]|nr:hypothetical protein [Patescibacteria group bacterium]
MKVGIAIIVSARPQELKKAIKSAKGLYDYLSICVVEHKGAKLEKTIKVANRYGAIVSKYKVRVGWDHPFIDDFASARNQAVEFLPDDTDWVFILDSDDIVLDPEEIRNHLEEMKKPMVAMVRILAPDKLSSLLQIRVWSTDVDIYWLGRVHELPQFDKDKIELVSLPDVKIHHVPKKTKIHHNRNDIILKDMIDNGEATSRENFFYAESRYIQSLQRKKGWKKIEKEAIKSFTKLKDLKDIYTARYKILCYLADYSITKSTNDKSPLDPAIEHILDALKYSVFYPEPYYLMGKALYLTNKMNNAIGWLKQALELPEVVSIWHSTNYFRRSLPVEQLAFCYLEIGNNNKAYEYHALARTLDDSLKKNDKLFGVV